MSTAWPGLVLTSASQILPSLPRAAEVLTPKMLVASTLYCTLLINASGSDYASWNGTYIL